MKECIIAVDAMGGDNAPYDIVKGSINAINKNNNIKIVLVGKEDTINDELKKYKYNQEQIIIENATEIIQTTESPTIAIREKKDSSIVKGLKLLKDGKADAFVSAGSTGALLTGATVIIKRIKGIERPALATLIPNAKDKYTFLIDAGANMDCKPSYLPNFAKMGQIYMQDVMNVENPKVAIVNVGEEKEKGDSFTKEAYNLLEQTKGINFVGNIEGREIPEGQADVVVCDGFVGNVALKVTEGTSQMLFRMLKQEFKADILGKIIGLMAKPFMKRIYTKINYEEFGGALLLGVKGITVISHGRSKAYAIKNAVRVAKHAVETGVNEKIAKFYEE